MYSQEEFRALADILVSESTAKSVGSTIIMRDFGKFVVAGKSSAIGVCEVVAVADGNLGRPAWLETFLGARHALTAGDFPTAESLFREVIQMRGGKDGPSEFFLTHLADLRNPSSAEPWDGIVRLQKK